jgi:hypothetical protein
VNPRAKGYDNLQLKCRECEHCGDSDYMDGENKGAYLFGCRRLSCGEPHFSCFVPYVDHI